MTTPHDRAIEAAAKVMAQRSGTALRYSGDYIPNLEAAISAYLTSLAGDVEPMKLMARKPTGAMLIRHLKTLAV